MKEDDRFSDNRSVQLEMKSKINDDEQQKILSEKQSNTKSVNNFVDFMDLQADITVALEHSYSQKMYKLDYEKINDSSIQTCKCCSLPLPKENIIEEFRLCTDNQEFSEVGISIFLYLTFIKFNIIVLFVLIGMNSIIQLIISNSFYQILKTYCSRNSTMPIFVQGNCTNFNSMKDDWMFVMSSQNVEFYYNITNVIYSPNNSIYYVDYAFINFLCMMVLIVINYLFKIMVRNVVIEHRYEKISPSNFTVFATNLPVNLQDLEELKNELTTVKFIILYRTNYSLKK